MNWVLLWVTVGVVLMTFAKLIGYHRFPSLSEMIYSAIFWPFMLVISIRRARKRK